jgi:ribonuclease P protein component
MLVASNPGACRSVKCQARFQIEPGAHSNAQAHISTQPASSLESAWLPLTHEDQIRCGRIEPPPCRGPQARLSQRRISRLSLPPICFGWNSLRIRFRPESLPITMSALSKPDPYIATLVVRKGGRASLTGSRLRKHADYQRVYAQARKRRSASMSWFLAPQSAGRGQPETSTARVGLTAGKVLGKAHDRNRIKRRLREVLRRHVEELPPGCDLILHPHRSVLTMEFTKLDAEIVRILEQANGDCARANQVDSRRAAKTEAER